MSIPFSTNNQSTLPPNLTAKAEQLTKQWFANPVRLLAPMDGLTDPLMREILTQIAVDLHHKNNINKGEQAGYNWSVSEFIRVTQTVLPDHVFYKYAPELHNNSKTASNTPIHIQILGSDPQLMAENALRACALGSPAIDINFGCPAKTVNSHRGGSVLLTEPTVIREIISAVKATVPADVPVSAKIRLGYENTNNMDDIRQAIADSGANWLTIHARTKTQGYKPPAYWDKIERFTELNIPIVANGEIWTPEQANKCMRQSNTTHIMLGRGAVTRPDLVTRINDDVHQIFKTEKQDNIITWQQLIPHQIKFLEAKAKSDIIIIGRYKQWLGMLTKGYNEAVPIWDKVKREKNKEVIVKLLHESSYA